MLGVISVFSSVSEGPRGSLFLSLCKHTQGRDAVLQHTQGRDAVLQHTQGRDAVLPHNQGRHAIL